MENASKALIIAGAILVAILLISVGILVLNNVNKPLGEAESEGNSMAAQMFNARFQNYIGTDKTASEVRQLLRLILAHNSNPKNHIIYASYKMKNGTYYKENGIQVSRT